MTKIIDKIESRRKKYRRNLNSTSSSPSEEDQNKTSVDSQKVGEIPGWYYSFEFFPPKTEAGLENLFTRIDRMTRRLDPLFVDVTWGSGASTSARTMAVASHAQRFCGADVLLHLTTTGMSRDQLASALQQAKMGGIHNILVLRGDPPRGKHSWARGDVSGGACDRAIDLVKLIRELHGNYFGIAVAGHPESHPSSNSLEEELKHLKQKLGAGADFIITQFFYDTDAFLDFVKRCREYGITCPIMPGIMPIQSFSSFVRMTQYCGVKVPTSVMERLEPVRHDDEAIKEIGCDIAAGMCRRILAESDVDGVHFYTLNLERSVTRILMNMGAIDFVRPNNNDEQVKSSETNSSVGTSSHHSDAVADDVRPTSERQLPWRPSAMAQRSKEEVR
jgi:methylenetetrahydrofolate reductase (NADPH)